MDRNRNMDMLTENLRSLIYSWILNQHLLLQILYYYYENKWLLDTK